MMSSPFPTLVVCLAYAYFVKVSHISYLYYIILYVCFILKYIVDVQPFIAPFQSSIHLKYGFLFSFIFQYNIIT